MIPGRFISLEGGEGAGKSTQARLLVEALEEGGHDVLLTREPGGTPGAEAIRALLLDPPGQGWNPAAEALLFAAARSDHVEQAIRPALQEGRWVVCDRFVDSSRAYQSGADRLTDATLLELHRIGSGGIMPDMTLLFDIDPAVAAIRVAERDGEVSDAIGGRGAVYHARVADAFDTLARKEPGRIKRIAGDGDAQAVHRRVWESIAPLLAERN